VIVILGIMLLTVADIFIDLNGDAKVAFLKGVKGAIESVAKLVYSKSVIHGVDDVKPIMHDNPLNPSDISFR
jgi:hypothetical protein